MFDWDELPSASFHGPSEDSEGRGGDASTTADDSRWQVVHTGPVQVRAAASLQARILGVKQPGAQVRGEPDGGGWLRLLDEPGFMKIRADFCPFLLRAAECSAGFEWVGASKVFEQLEQEISEGRRDAAALVASRSKPKPPTLKLPPRATAAAETTEDAASGAAGGGEEEQQMTVNLAEGTQEGAGEEAMTDARREWLARAQSWLQRLDPKATVPPTARLPASAFGWEPAAAVLFVLTHGHFDPRRDVPWLGDGQAAAAAATGQRPNLVSVCCATSDRRRTFHPLIYENFRKQTHEPRELVVVHTGELPSDFFMEKARTDSRVTYKFFPVTREAPGSPRLSDEKTGSPWDAVLVDDDPAELTYWEQGDLWAWEIRREGWTKGLKRNVACCIARGSVIVHFDEGCLYAPTYIGRLLTEVKAKRVSDGPRLGPLAGVLSKWYTLGISDLDFRLVDMKRPDPLWEQYGHDARRGQEKDQYNHGFAYVYTRTAWEQQPFPDVETVGTTDSDFMKALRSQGAPVQLFDLGTQEPLAACGWHRDATCGAKDAPANINNAQVLDFFRFRGEDTRSPSIFGDSMHLVREIASDLLARRERYLRDLVQEHGSVHVCAYCNFAVALARNVTEPGRHISTSMHVVDGLEMTKTFAKEHMKFEVCQISKAGGAVAEGHWAPTPAGHGWLSSVNQRMAMCRNCGFQLGWRFEPEGLPKECSSPCCTFQAKPGREYCCPACRTRGPHHHDTDCEKKDAPPPKVPITWGLIWRHLRQRRKPGERVPEDTDVRRHRETDRNFRKHDVCPEGHSLRCFCTGQGNGGALPFYYTCDICDRPARGSEHLWGCGTCDYDMCERCRSKRG